MRNKFYHFRQIFICCAVAFFLPYLKAQQLVAPSMMADNNKPGRSARFDCCTSLMVTPPSTGGASARSTLPVPTEKAVFGGVKPGSTVEVTVLDARGEMVNESLWSVGNNNSKISVDLSKLPNASYFIQVKSGSQVEIYNPGDVGLPPKLVSRWTASDEVPPRRHWCKDTGTFVDHCDKCSGGCDSFISVVFERGNVLELPQKGPIKTPEVDKNALLAILKNLSPRETSFKLAVDKNGRPTKITKVADCPVGGFLFQFKQTDK